MLQPTHSVKVLTTIPHALCNKTDIQVTRKNLIKVGIAKWQKVGKQGGDDSI